MCKKGRNRVECRNLKLISKSKNIQFEWRTDRMSYVTLTIELVLVRVSYQSNSRVMVSLRTSNTLVETAQQVQG